MEFLCVFFAVLFWQSVTCTLVDNHQNQAASLGEAQNNVIEELKKQNNDMNAMMEELAMKFEDKLIHQEQKFKQELALQEEKFEDKLVRCDKQHKQKLAHLDETLLHQQEEIASLKSEIFARFDTVTEISDNAVVAENGKKLFQCSIYLTFRVLSTCTRF